jgi:hypothetical protein
LLTPISITKSNKGGAEHSGSKNDLKHSGSKNDLKHSGWKKLDERSNLERESEMNTVM